VNVKLTKSRGEKISLELACETVYRWCPSVSEFQTAGPVPFPNLRTCPWLNVVCRISRKQTRTWRPRLPPASNRT